MKKVVLILLCFVLIFGICGCESTKSDKLSVVCTNYAVYDWVCEVVGKDASDIEVHLLANGADIHSYQPTAQDIALLHSCDLAVYVGGSSDGWIEKISEENGISTLKLSDVVGDKLLCGHQEHSGSEHKHSSEDFDEHIWLSLKLSQDMVYGICDRICDISEDNADRFKKNAVNYVLMLDNLDRQYEEAVEASADRTVVFPDRFPFLYMTEDYGIKCFSAFPGCSADSDASLGMIAELSKAVDEYQKKTLLVLEKSTLSVAEAVVESTKEKSAKTAVMNSCQSVTSNEMEQGISYIKIMEENLESLKMALQ